MSGLGKTSRCVEFHSITSLSSAKSRTPPAPAPPTREAMWLIHWVTKVGPIAIEVSAGLLPTILPPTQ